VSSPHRFCGPSAEEPCSDLTRAVKVYLPGIPVYTNGLKAVAIGNMYWFVFFLPCEPAILMLNAHCRIYVGINPEDYNTFPVVELLPYRA
jgi:hypothetical protein